MRKKRWHPKVQSVEGFLAVVICALLAGWILFEFQKSSFADEPRLPNRSGTKLADSSKALEHRFDSATTYLIENISEGFRLRVRVETANMATSSFFMNIVSTDEGMRVGCFLKFVEVAKKVASEAKKTIVPLRPEDVSISLADGLSTAAGVVRFVD